MNPSVSKPKLLVVELWGVGDVVIAAPFLQAASNVFDVTLLAKRHAQALAARFFPSIKVLTFVAPWTAFRHKYRLLNWRWPEILRLRAGIVKEGFQVGLSARWDPRDHALLRWLGIPRRIGFPRLGSGTLLTDSLPRPSPEAHRYEYWRRAGRSLNLKMPSREEIQAPPGPRGETVVIHTGAGQPVKVWPLERYRNLVARLRGTDYTVLVLCDAEQQQWWLAAGEKDVTVPRSVEELSATFGQAGAFIGNDSGPGHVAALSGVPTFTLFSSGLPEWFAPLHPAAEWVIKPCPYRPCWDSCRFPTPNCTRDLDEELVWSRVRQFVAKHVPKC